MVVCRGVVGRTTYGKKLYHPPNWRITMAKEDVSRDEQIGFHKGALSTLAKEREEFQKVTAIVEQLMQMHVKALKDLGVDLERMAKDAVKKTEDKKKTPLEGKI